VIKLDATYYHNAMSYNSFINTVYDLVVQPSYMLLCWVEKHCTTERNFPIRAAFIWMYET